jgi:hypothetical protein
MTSTRKPIYSIHEDDLTLQGSVNEFVIGLAGWVDALQDVHSGRDFSRLGTLCGELAEAAARLGYPRLAGVARRAVEACLVSKAEASEEALVEMAELAQCIRQAHRGAA